MTIDGVDARARTLDDGVVSITEILRLGQVGEDVGVVAGAAGQRVQAAEAVEGVITGLADKSLMAVLPVSTLASALPVRLNASVADDAAVLDVGAERVGSMRRPIGIVDRRDAHGVDARARALDDGVVVQAGNCASAQVAELVVIVAGAAREDVETGEALKIVVAGIAGQTIVERVAEAVDVGRTGEDEIFEFIIAQTQRTDEWTVSWPPPLNS